MGSIARMRSAQIFAALLVIGAAILFFHIGTAKASPGNQITVKWLIAHQPTDVFKNATKVFADELAKDSNGHLKLEVVMPQDVGVAEGDIPNAKVMQLLDSGNVQLATTYTVALGQKDNALWALNLPFAFSSYDQVSTFLDGTPGQQLLSTIGKSMNDEGLAFTMSGGFRIIASKDVAIQSPADMQGLRIGTSGGPVAEATLKALGAIPVPLDLESGQADLTKLDGVETTYSRLSEVVGSNSPYTKYINETDHSVFLTVILADKTFMDSLSPSDQAAVRAAAFKAAQVERQDSEALAARTKIELAAGGSKITTLPTDRSLFERATRTVYAQFAPMFGSTVISSMTQPQ